MIENARLFRTLADPARLRILGLLLRAGELCVCDIERVLGCTQTKVSRHLAYLRRAGLVTGRRQGLWMLYGLTRPATRGRRILHETLVRLVAADPAARRDARTLARAVRDGCCATASLPAPMSGCRRPRMTNTK